MQRLSLICLLNVVVATTAAGVYGGVNIDPNAATAQAGATFPKIPGLNSPLFGFSLFPPRNGPGGLNGPPGGDGFGNIFRPPPPPAGAQQPNTLPPLPNITSLVPELQNSENASSIYVPPIRGPPPLPLMPPIPGLSEALQDARNHVETALGLGNNFVGGIQTALEQAFQNNDPTGAVRTLVNTILDAYLTVAENCPMIVIGTRVLQEGIRLASEVAKSARNVILGPSS